MISISEKNYIPQLSIDCVIFGYHDQQLKVLAPKFKFVGDFWSLPGGFILQNESIDDAARRILEERTGISNIFVEQYRVFGEATRNNMAAFKDFLSMNQDKFGGAELFEKEFNWLTQRFVSIGYYALVDNTKVVPQLTAFDESIEWYPIHDLPNMILDHNEQVHKALEMLRINFDRKLIGFSLLPEKFTMKELQGLYETVHDQPVRRNNFQKKMLDMDVLERLDKQFTGAANKAPYLYRFKLADGLLFS